MKQWIAPVSLPLHQRYSLDQGNHGKKKGTILNNKCLLYISSYMYLFLFYFLTAMFGEHLYISNVDKIFSFIFLYLLVIFLNISFLRVLTSQDFHAFQELQLDYSFADVLQISISLKC